MRNTNSICYQSKSAIVRGSVISDAFNLAPNVRKSDKEEIWKSHHKIPETALIDGYTKSLITLTVERYEVPVAMFGINPLSLINDKAVIWLLASDDIYKIKYEFLKQCRKFIRLFLDIYPLLFNWVDVENKTTLKWLKFCGCKLGPVLPYGTEKAPFQYFEFRKGEI